jgi:hypothetical protein
MLSWRPNFSSNPQIPKLCREHAHLSELLYQAVIEQYKAARDLKSSMGRVPPDEWERLSQQAEVAQTRSKEAQATFEQHCALHGC